MGAFGELHTVAWILIALQLLLCVAVLFWLRDRES